jgi:simple sugar transport system ATP-binding protein
MKDELVSIGAEGVTLREFARGRPNVWDVRTGPKLILMDGPTAALGVAETAKVESIGLGGSRARAAHSHDQPQSGSSLRLSDRICVLRRGKQIGVLPTSSVDKNEIVSMISGLSRGQRDA